MKRRVYRVVLCALLGVILISMSACDDKTSTSDSTVSTDTAELTANVTEEQTIFSDTTDTPSTETSAPDTSVPDTTADTVPDTTAPDTAAPDTTAPDPEPGYEPIDPDKIDGISLEAYSWCTAAISAAEKGEVLSPSNDTSSFGERWSSVYKVISNEMLRVYDEFTSGNISYTTLECFMKSCSSIPNAKGLSEGYITLAQSRRADIDLYAEAKRLADKGNFKKATMAIAKIDKNNNDAHLNAKTIIDGNYDAATAGVTEAVTEYMVRYEIAAGKAYLSALRGYGIDAHIDAELARLEEYRKYQDEGLVEIDLRDSLENIYTHCLIAFPEINFASQKSYSACGPDCLTPYEFKFLLQSLYDRDYIIIDANLVYNEEGDCPNYKMKLPEGKKPVLFTFDDVTYDSRKMGRGMVDKLIVDEFGYVCTYTKHKDGGEVVSYDNELFPILDAFVRQHPDFTFRGARGTLFFTGFDGICGYRTQSEPVDDAEAKLNIDRQAEIAAAKVVIEAMREEGWTFGSHGYDHSHMPRISPEKFRWEIDTWREEVGAIIGDTALFCWPYGHHTEGDVSIRKNEQHKYLFDSGFKFMFGCGSGRYLANEPDGLGIFSDRKGITGSALLYIAAGYKAYVRDYPYLFDPDKIWDPLRLPYKEWLLSTV